MAWKDVLARRYAGGLVENARDAEARERIQADLELLAGMFDPSAAEYAPEFRDCLASPVLSIREKLELAAAILGRLGMGEEAVSFLAVLIRRDRADILSRVAAAFAELADDADGRVTAAVHTARPLSDDQGERLADALSAALGRRVRLRQSVEPGLLAGARVEAGGMVFDGSTLGGLERLRSRLAAVLAR